MASDRCPSCSSPSTSPIDGITRDEQVNYHRCDKCPHVWITYEDGRPIQHVTPLGAYDAMLRRAPTRKTH